MPYQEHPGAVYEIPSEVCYFSILHISQNVAYFDGMRDPNVVGHEKSTFESHISGTEITRKSAISLSSLGKEWVICS